MLHVYYADLDATTCLLGLGYMFISCTIISYIIHGSNVPINAF